MGPNVVLIVLDSARADALEPYGAAPGRSPVIGQLAAAGTAMRDVFATASWTVPSHGSMFTGLLPRAAGLQGAPGMKLHDLPPVLRAQRDRLLPSVMARAGYRTGAVSTNLWLSEASGFSTGFDDFVSIVSERQAKIHTKSRRERARWLMEAARAKVDDGAAEAGRVLREWIDNGDPDQPFFCFVNLVECHSPYLPPKPYNQLGPIGRVRAALEARRHLTLAAIWQVSAGEAEVPPEALERMRRLYEGAISYVDRWVGELLEALGEKHLLDETVVIVTSDHGENLGEGGLITHSLSLDDRLIRVPLVLAGPGAQSTPPIRSLAELPRMIAGLAGIEDHPWLADDLPAGAAIAQLDPPADPGDPRATAFAEQWGLGERGLQRLTTPATCATDGRWKLLEWGTEEMLFDTTADPFELQPLDPGEQFAPANGISAPVEQLRRALRHPSVTSSPAAQSGRRDSTGESISDQERLELEERMRLLGYL